MSNKVIPRRLQGKVAVVTAATLGIGYAIAERLAQEGASVMISSRKQDNVDKAVADLRKKGYDIRGMVCHVAKPGDRERLMNATVKQFGGIDILVSNAGVNPAILPMLETTEELWDKVFDVNVKATFFVIKEAVPHMEKRGGGSIVMVTSHGAYVHYASVLALYGTSKTAMLGLTKHLAPQLAEKNIRVNGLAPGLIKTRMNRGLWENDTEDKFTQDNPIKRAGTCEEMAAVTAFLVSDDASYITAETIVANGGGFSRL